MSFSRVVGMKAPGLNSLFVGLNIKFSNNIQNNKLIGKLLGIQMKDLLLF